MSVQFSSKLIHPLFLEVLFRSMILLPRITNWYHAVSWMVFKKYLPLDHKEQVNWSLDLICHGHISRSSRNGVLNGSLMSPEATKIDKVQIGITHWNTNMRTFFPANSKSIKANCKNLYMNISTFLDIDFFFPESIADLYSDEIFGTFLFKLLHFIFFV